MKIDKKHHLTWLDIHSLNLEPSESILLEIAKCLKQRYCKSWISKYVIDSYIAVLTKNSTLKVTNKCSDH